MTDFTREVLLIAQRVVVECADGRHVDPARLAWAHGVIKAHAQAGSPRDPSDAVQVRRPVGSWERQAEQSGLRHAEPFDGLQA